MRYDVEMAGSEIKQTESKKPHGEAMADSLRGLMNTAEYRATVLAEYRAGATEDRNEYSMEDIFWVPPEVCWKNLKVLGLWGHVK